MGQLIESRFRVLDFDPDDVLLNDIANSGLPVYVNKELEGYRDELQSKIHDLEKGNVIEAEIKSESLTRQDDTWKFITLSIVEETRFHFIEDAALDGGHIEKGKEIIEKTEKNAVRLPLSSNGEQTGYITIAEDEGDKFWNRLRMGVNTHESDMENLGNIGEPPHEVIYTRDSERNQMVFYHFASLDSELADVILRKSENQ